MDFKIVFKDNGHRRKTMKRKTTMKFFNFEVVIEKEPESEGYLAYSPGLKGCFSNGQTIEAARRNIREALVQHLQSCLANNIPVPQQEHLVHVEEIAVGIAE